MMKLDFIQKVKQRLHFDKIPEVDDKITKGVRVSICVIIFGITGMCLLSMMKKAPVEVQREKPSLQVEVIKAEKKDYPVYLSAYGEAGSVRIVPIAPEVSGKIIKTHLRLEDGEIIQKGEVLFKIDPSNYELIVKSGRERLGILERSTELAEKDFQRVKNLFEKNKVGTISGVEAAEKVWLSAADALSRIAQVVETAEINLRRCEVRAQFNGRLNNVSLENGQFVLAGKRVLTFVDDMVLDINVSIDSSEAGKWLYFEQTKKTKWFAGIKQVPCEIRWTESLSVRPWKGILHRIVEYDRKTRTVTLAVRADCNETEWGGNGDGNLVDGMFCSVKIPGKTMYNVIRLPRSTLSMENTVYTAVNNRLVTVPVDLLRSEDDYVYVNGGIDNNDLIVTTRLVNPLEKSVLSIMNPIEVIDKTKG